MAWNLHAAEGCGAATSHFNLCAADVELRGPGWVVDSELLNADEILASGNARRDGNAVGLFQIPCAAGEGRANLLDLDKQVSRASSFSMASTNLEPVRAAISTGGAGHWRHVATARQP